MVRVLHSLDKTLWSRQISTLCLSLAASLGVSPSKTAAVSGVTWTADGREIIFSSSNPFVRNGSLWRIQASGGAVEQFTIAGYNVMYPHISRRGNRLAYVQASGDYNIYKIDVSGTTVSKNPPTKLIASTRNDASPQFSPDGRRIVFASDRSGSSEIWTCDSDGSNVIQMTSLNKEAGTPRWSPDGQQIAFDLFEDRRGHIYVINTAGGQPRPITTGDFDDIVPSWSRNGKWIYFASNRTGVYQVWRVPAEGGEAVQLTTLGGGLAFESFDGSLFASSVGNILASGECPWMAAKRFRSWIRSIQHNADWAVVRMAFTLSIPNRKTDRHGVFDCDSAR